MNDFIYPLVISFLCAFALFSLSLGRDFALLLDYLAFVLLSFEV